MPQYMLLIRGDDEVDRSPAEMQAVVSEYIAWAGKLRAAEQMLGGDELAANGWVIRSSGVTDGPYAESKEGVGGYFLIEAADDAAAVEITRACPGLVRGGLVELRPIVDHSGS